MHGPAWRRRLVFFFIVILAVVKPFGVLRHRAQLGKPDGRAASVRFTVS